MALQKYRTNIYTECKYIEFEIDTKKIKNKQKYIIKIYSHPNTNILKIKNIILGCFVEDSVWTSFNLNSSKDIVNFIMSFFESSKLIEEILVIDNNGIGYEYGERILYSESSRLIL